MYKFLVFYTQSTYMVLATVANTVGWVERWSDVVWLFLTIKAVRERNPIHFKYQPQAGLSQPLAVLHNSNKTWMIDLS